MKRIQANSIQEMMKRPGNAANVIREPVTEIQNREKPPEQLKIFRR